MEETGVPFGEAVRNVAQMTVFTTHTPVAAGHDRFPAPMVEEHLGKIRESLHLSYDDFMGLGRVFPGDHERAVLHDRAGLEALAARQRRQRACTGSSRGGCGSRCSRRRPRKRCRSATSPTASTSRAGSPAQMHLLFDRHLGTDWPTRQRDPKTWAGIKTVEDAELWETQQVLKARLIEFVRGRLVVQAKRRTRGTRPSSAPARCSTRTP